MYEQNSFVPVARVVQLSTVNEKQRVAEGVAYVRRYVPSGIVTQDVLADIEQAKVPLVKIYHYHVNHLGTPQELTNQEGDVIWLSYDKAWGGSFDSFYRQQFVDNWAVTGNELQPFKFQGQCLDVETGLHYNRFRYYDSDVGMFISRDPIGLMGGNNVFQYAPNPVMWIDPWGLLRFGAGHPDLFPTTGSQKNIVQITMQGSRGRDFTEAFKQAGIDRKLAKGYTWHHVDDFNPKTGITTMELVKTDGDHQQYHKGSVNQYEEKFKVKYDTRDSLKVALKKNWVKGRIPKWWKDLMSKKKFKCT